MKAIETFHNDHWFRSRLEARWALFFDTLGIEYQYEPEGFDLDGVWYLPDFYIPSADIFIEIKGNYVFYDKQLGKEAVHKCVGLSWQSRKKVLLLFGGFTSSRGWDRFILFLPAFRIDITPVEIGVVGIGSFAITDLSHTLVFIGDIYDIPELLYQKPKNLVSWSSEKIKKAIDAGSFGACRRILLPLLALDEFSMLVTKDTELGIKKKSELADLSPVKQTYVLGEGNPLFCGVNSALLDSEKLKQVTYAYTAARQARFEHKGKR